MFRTKLVHYERFCTDTECAELMQYAIPHGLDYDSAKKIMIGVFKRDSKTVSDMEQQFERAKQEADESIDLFYVRLLSLASKAFADRTQEAIIEKIMCKFVRGLNSIAIEKQLQTENIQDMATFLKRAKVIEESLKRYAEYGVEPKLQKQENPSNRNESVEQQRDSTPNRENVNRYRTITQNQQTQQRPNFNGCYKCGQSGI